jgi:hypothetical protein
MADKFLIQYSASATPIEQLGAADGSSSVRLVHSDIDKSIGGSLEIDCDATKTNVAYLDHPTTATTTDKPLNSITDIDFLMVTIREAVDADEVCDVVIEISGTVVSKLLKVGDVVILRPVGLAGSAIEIYSSDAGKLCKLDILYGLE